MKKYVLLTLIFFTSIFSYAHKEKWDDNRKDWSKLMLAIYKGQTNKISKLIENEKTDINFFTKGKNSNWILSAMNVAIFKKDESTVKLLLETNRVLNPGQYLIDACAGESPYIVDILIKFGANPNETLENGYCVAMMAASFGSYEVLETLLKHGVNLKQARKIDGITPLMLAALRRDIKKVKLLIDYGAEIDVKDEKGQTALDYVNRAQSKYKNDNEEIKNELISLLKS